jgi:hypothetical protein
MNVLVPFEPATSTLPSGRGAAAAGNIPVAIDPVGLQNGLAVAVAGTRDMATKATAAMNPKTRFI